MAARPSLCAIRFVTAPRADWRRLCSGQKRICRKLCEWKIWRGGRRCHRVLSPDDFRSRLAPRHTNGSCISACFPPSDAWRKLGKVLIELPKRSDSKVLRRSVSISAACCAPRQRLTGVSSHSGRSKLKEWLDLISAWIHEIRQVIRKLPSPDRPG